MIENVRMCVRASTGVCANHWTIQGRITKLGPVVQNTLVKIPIVLSVTDHDLIAQI